MKLQRVKIENYRAINRINLPLHPRLTVLHGGNAHGKTSVLSAIAVGLGAISRLLPHVSGNGFLKTDHRTNGGGQPLPLRVGLTTVDGISWHRQRLGKRGGGAAQHELREHIEAIIEADREAAQPIDLPIFAFYGAGRTVPDVPRPRPSAKTHFTRYEALQGSLSSRTNFHQLFEWLHVKEHEELRQQKARRDVDFQLQELRTVRGAMQSMVRGVSQPGATHAPVRFVASADGRQGAKAALSLHQLGGGYRIVLALAADLAWRMAQGNAHLGNPLRSQAIVLIDEVELHLHPSWQQRVLKDLQRTFPNAQFIVATNSPQVFTTVQPEHILGLYRQGDGIVAHSAPLIATYGARAGDVPQGIMGVGERPPDNEFVKVLQAYMKLVNAGKGEQNKALALRKQLEALSPRDFSLDEADVEMRRQRVMKSLEEG